MVVAVSDPVEQYRLALSYVDKVNREKEKWTRIVDSQRVKITKFDTIASSYRDHERTANALKKRLWKPHHNQLPDLQESLRKKNLEQKSIIKDIQRGKVKPQKANEINRNLTHEMIVLQKSIHVSKAIVDAQSAVDLGGLIDLPIDEYAPRIDPDYLAYKHDEGIDKKKISLEQIIKTTIALVAVIAIWAGWSYYTSLGKGQFSIEKTQGRSQRIEISCKNNGDSRIKVFAPWPGGVTTTPDQERFPRRAFGIQLYIKERGQDVFRLLPSSPGCWFRGGNRITEGTPVNVTANRIRRIQFEPEGLKELGIEAAAVRLVISRNGGKEILEFETNLKR